MEKLSVLKIKAKNGECMHMKYKSIIIIEWNDLPIIKFTSTIWRPSHGEIFLKNYYNNEHVFLQF
jgi:hypothetical protein